jgi:hypothetical protein
MADSSGAHKPLRREWAETPADVSYRFVVSPGTLRAAEAVARASLQKRKNQWQREIALLVRYILRLVVGALVIALFGWLSWLLALVVDRALETTQRFGSGALPPIVTFLVTFLGLLVGFRIAIRRWARLSFHRFYCEFYSNNEFLLEGRKSHLWFDEQSAGAIRRWSTFERVVEFEEGMWLFLRRRTTFAGLRGILISKDSLPNSCTWSELQMYLSQRIHEGAVNEAEVRNRIECERARSDRESAENTNPV